MAEVLEQSADVSSKRVTTMVLFLETANIPVHFCSSESLIRSTYGPVWGEAFHPPEEVGDVGLLQVVKELLVLLRRGGVHPNREDVGRVELLVKPLEETRK